MRKAALLAFLAMASSAMAAEHGAPAAKKEAGHEPKKGGKPGTNVDMPYLMAPLTNANGKLTGYAYIATRLTATSEGVVTDVREKLPFIQDLMVRNVNNKTVTTADDPEKVDIPGVEARLLADARKVMGAGKVKEIMVCTVQIAELRPVKTPALHAPAEEAHDPHAAPPKNPTKSRCET